MQKSHYWAEFVPVGGTGEDAHWMGGPGVRPCAGLGVPDIYIILNVLILACFK